jgi:hypothetical protein
MDAGLLNWRDPMASDTVGVLNRGRPISARCYLVEIDLTGLTYGAAPNLGVAITVPGIDNIVAMVRTRGIANVSPSYQDGYLRLFAVSTGAEFGAGTNLNAYGKFQMLAIAV